MGVSCSFDRGVIITHSMQTAPTLKLRLRAYLNLLLPPFPPPHRLFIWNHTGSELEADGVLHSLDSCVIRPFRVSEVTCWQLRSVLALVDGLPHTGPIMYLIIGVLGLRLKAAVKFAPQTFPELEGALCVWDAVFLLLQFGVVVRKLVEQDGDGHAVEDDAERDATKCHTAAKIWDGDDITIANSRDAHL